MLYVHIHVQYVLASQNIHVLGRVCKIGLVGIKHLFLWSYHGKRFFVDGFRLVCWPVVVGLLASWVIWWPIQNPLRSDKVILLTHEFSTLAGEWSKDSSPSIIDLSNPMILSVTKSLIGTYPLNRWLSKYCTSMAIFVGWSIQPWDLGLPKVYQLSATSGAAGEKHPWVMETWSSPAQTGWLQGIAGYPLVN